MADFLRLNGCEVALPSNGTMRLSSFLRDELALTGTKIGCERGDCGSCTIIVDGQAVASCLQSVGGVAGCSVVTIEGLATCTVAGKSLQDAFLRHQAVQCGFCIPGFLMTSAAFLESGRDGEVFEPRRDLAGILCRCTGYQKILSAVLEVASGVAPRAPAPLPSVGNAVGADITRLDGREKVDGSQHFGADGIPRAALRAIAVRSPFHRAQFRLGDLEAFKADHPGIEAILTAGDVPGRNLHGVAAPFADQPVFAEEEVRFVGEAIALIVGEARSVQSLNLEDFPVSWTPLEPYLSMLASTADGQDLIHETRPGNILIRGHVERGDVEDAFHAADHIVSGTFSTQFVEHAYLEPEAGWAERNGDTISIYSCSQAPHAHRSDLALILDLPPEAVRVVPTAVGGGFGGKLDLTVQPFIAIAAWRLNKPVGMVFSREESIAASTKRHPAHMKSRMCATNDGILTGVDFEGDFDTGAYASWGTAVANRVPVHASGPYSVANYRARTRAIHTHVTPSGAFRGFGVPQTCFAQEQLIDELADNLGMDPLEFRLRNALRVDQPIATGQILPDSVGMEACLEALRPRWNQARREAASTNGENFNLRRGVGLAAMIYGCGNTASANPSTIRIGVRPDGSVVLHQGAVDVGQGSNTVIPQIAADAIGIAVHDLRIVGAATHLTPDCGRTSASRQTFVTGRAAEFAGKALRRRILSLSNAGPDAVLSFGKGRVAVADQGEVRRIELECMEPDEFGYVLRAEETFDPPSTPLDAMGRGSPYALYTFGAQLAEVEVDCALGMVRVTRVTAAYDVGKVVNPSLLEGQIEGAVAQGIGMALTERFIAGSTRNFQDYLMPTLRDVPPVDCIFIEAEAGLGPYGAKGIGEPALVPTAAAIANAIRSAIGCCIETLPATPDVILAALAQNNLDFSRNTL